MEGALSFDVLIACDDERALEYLEDAVVAVGLSCFRAPVRSEWQGLVAVLDPFVVVVDLRTRPEEGLALLRSLRRAPMPVLALADDAAAADEAADLGAVTLLEPFAGGDAIAVLVDLVTTETLLRARRAHESELRDDGRALVLWERIKPPSVARAGPQRSTRAR